MKGYYPIKNGVYVFVLINGEKTKGYITNSYFKNKKYMYDIQTENSLEKNVIEDKLIILTQIKIKS